MTFSSFNRAGAADAPAAAFSPQSMCERKAQYAAWRERMMQRTRDDDVIDLADAEPSRWSVESLFTDGWVADGRIADDSVAG